MLSGHSRNSRTSGSSRTSRIRGQKRGEGSCQSRQFHRLSNAKCLFHRPVVIFQGDSNDGLPGTPGKKGDPGDRVGQTQLSVQHNDDIFHFML